MAFRKHTLLPLDDCLYALQATIPHLTRSSLHRCYQRHGVSRLPDTEGDKPAKKAFNAYPIGYFHIDIAEVQTAQGKLFLFRWPSTGPANPRLREASPKKQIRMTASAFLTEALIDAGSPGTIQHLSMDRQGDVRSTCLARSCQTTSPRRYAKHTMSRSVVRCRKTASSSGAQTRTSLGLHRPGRACMNRTLIEATVRRYRCETHDQRREHLDIFLAANNFAKRLKTLLGLTPY